jgi:hypothetical protein
MIIRSEQFDALVDAAMVNFAWRLAMHIRRTLPEARVSQIGRTSTVAEMNGKDLETLVRCGIDRAKQFELSWESTIAKFVSLMVEVAPNFYQHPGLYQRLANKKIHQQIRIDSLFTAIDDSIWEEAVADYDPRAWTAKEAMVEESAS